MFNRLNLSDSVPTGAHHADEGVCTAAEPTRDHANVCGLRTANRRPVPAAGRSGSRMARGMPQVRRLRTIAR